MMSYQLLKDILPYLEQYSALFPAKTDLSGFLGWMQEVRQEEQGGNDDVLLENCIAIIHLYRYARLYAKEMLSNNRLFQFDDFGYLIQLYPNSKQTKMALIEQNIHEKSTGMEILKRLTRKGLLEELPNPMDKRSKVMQLTALGVAEVRTALWEMGNLTQTVNGNLKPTETRQLNQMLKKLSDYHQNVFVHKK